MISKQRVLQRREYLDDYFNQSLSGKNLKGPLGRLVKSWNSELNCRIKIFSYIKLILLDFSFSVQSFFEELI